MTAAVSSLLLTAICCMTSGCGESVSAEVREFRRQYLSDQPIAGENSVSKIREQIKSGEISAETPFVVRARINAGEMPPWGTGTASFVITDATGHDGDKEHNPHDCPFCSRNIQESIAQVHFQDKNGQLLQTDSRELFALRENQLVIVQGTGRIDDSDTLVITAQKMFVKN